MKLACSPTVYLLPFMNMLQKRWPNVAEKPCYIQILPGQTETDKVSIDKVVRDRDKELGPRERGVIGQIRDLSRKRDHKVPYRPFPFSHVDRTATFDLLLFFYVIQFIITYEDLTILLGIVSNSPDFL